MKNDEKIIAAVYLQENLSRLKYKSIYFHENIQNSHKNVDSIGDITLEKYYNYIEECEFRSFYLSIFTIDFWFGIHLLLCGLWTESDDCRVYMYISCT